MVRRKSSSAQPRQPRRKISITAGDGELEVHIGLPGCKEDCSELSVLHEALQQAAGREAETMALGGEEESRQTRGGVSSVEEGLRTEELARRLANAQKQKARQRSG